MKKFNFTLLMAFLIMIVISSCERDDICAESTPTTPHLILRFYDLANPDETSSVPSLFAYGLDGNNEIVNFQGMSISTTDSLVIPLRTDQDQTRLVIHQNYDPGDINQGNPDEILINYNREDIYVSRACGFKTVFNDLAFSVVQDTDNWIINSEVISINVDNEISAHVKIFH